MFTLPKSERLHGKSKISALMSKGRWGFTSGLKYCFVKNPFDETVDSNDNRFESLQQPNSIIVSVPKRLFKRAVKRNLLKRRLREAYRTQKGILPPKGYSILFLYNTKNVLEYASVREQIASVLQKIAEHEA